MPEPLTDREADKLLLESAYKVGFAKPIETAMTISEIESLIVYFDSKLQPISSDYFKRALAKKEKEK